jgi:peptidoglycan/LPS O-acetylase OafA/YrhL
LMAIAFASWSLLDGGLSTLQILHHGWESYSAHYQNSLWLPLAFFLQPLGSVIGAVAVWMLVADATPRRALRAALAPIFAVAAAVYVEWVPDEPQYLADTGNLTILALRIFFAVLVVVALVRHRLFDLDVRIRWTISRGWVAGIFLLVFFTVANVAENALDEKFGLLFGGIATGLLFFALNPLERFGQRIADAAVPHKKGPQEMAKDDRLRLYEDQARLVWADGTMGRKERALLDQLRQHLHLDAETAARIEHEAALGHLERAAST